MLPGDENIASLPLGMIDPLDPWMQMIGLSPSKIDFPTLCVTVEKRLCELGHLVPHQFPMTQREVVRSGKTVGVYFCVHGPRSVKLTAICDYCKNTVIFYGSDGIRRESLQVAVRQPVLEMVG